MKSALTSVPAGFYRSFALLIERLAEAKASALWNLAYDTGYGAGPAVFGLICVRTGYPAAFALTGALILATVPVALRERKTGIIDDDPGARPGHRGAPSMHAFPSPRDSGPTLTPPSAAHPMPASEHLVLDRYEAGERAGEPVGLGGAAGG